MVLLEILLTLDYNGNIELVLNNEGGNFWHVLPPIPK